MLCIESSIMMMRVGANAVGTGKVGHRSGAAVGSEREKERKRERG